MSSGRKERIVISCVTFETAKITDPIAFYQATRVHLIWYTKNPGSEKGKIYTDFYERVCEIIKEQSPFDVHIEGHSKDAVYDFTNMLRVVLSLIQKERKDFPQSDIYVNISAGSPEYTAAAAIASMMVPGTIPFSVSTEEYTINDNKRLKEIYYENGKPVGLTKKARDPFVVPYYPIAIPKEHLVRALRVLDNRKKGKLSITNTKMIEALKEKGLWTYPEETDIGRAKRKTDKSRSETVYYQRAYIDKWKEEGWIERNELTKKYEVTEEGRRILDTFFIAE